MPSSFDVILLIRSTCCLVYGALPRLARSSSGAPRCTGTTIIIWRHSHAFRSLEVPPYSTPTGETLQSLASIYGVSFQHLALMNPSVRKPFATLDTLTDVQLGIRFRVDPSSNVAAVLSNVHRAIGCNPRLLSPILTRNATRFGVDSICVVPQCSK